MFRVRIPQLYIVDFLILNACFLFMHQLSNERLMTASYLKLWLVINAFWALVSVWNKKFEGWQCRGLWSCVRFVGANALYMLYGTAVIAVFLGVTGVSRYHIIGTHVLYFIALSISVSVVSVIKGKHSVGSAAPVEKRQFSRHVIELFFIDLFLLIIGFGIVHYLKYHTPIPVEKSKEVLLIITAVWLATSLFTDKFKKGQDRNVYYAASPFIKSYLISSALMSVVVYAFHLFRYSRTLVFGSLLLLLVLELPIVLSRLLRKKEMQGEDIETIEEVKKFIKQNELPVEEKNSKVQEPADRVVSEIFLKDRPELDLYIQSYIDLKAIDRSQVQVMDTCTLYNVKILEKQSLRLFMNLHVLNDFRYLNQYLLQVHATLKNGGYFVIRKRRLENYREMLEAKFPNYIATLLYIIHFGWHRVCPKLPFLNRLYFVLSKGKKRVVTRAEVIGRLYFCGFKLIKFKRVGYSHWFIAQKLTTPIVEQNPSYGPFITLKRIGYQGALIDVYKFRTMHPYAEFLQQYVYETNALDESGKFNKDFRLTQWGKVLRKYWLDELPQLFNYFKGDLRFLGVRALSQHYYDLYPKDVQEMRIQHKPGLLPPYYADMPKNFEEIVESERTYLQEKRKAPFWTDVKYFSKAVYNIVFKKAHSK